MMSSDLSRKCTPHVQTVTVCVDVIVTQIVVATVMYFTLGSVPQYGIDYISIN